MKKSEHLWKRIFSQYSVLILVVISFVFLIIFFTTSRAMQRERRVTMEQQLEICTAALDNRVDEVMSLHLKFLNNNNFTSYVRSYYYGGMSEYQAEALEELLVSTVNDAWLVNTCYLLNDEFEIISSSRVILSADQNVEQVKASARDLAEKQAFRSFYFVEDRLLFLGAVYLNDSYDYVAYIGFELSPNRMFFNFTTKALESFQHVYVVDGSQAICTAGPALDMEPSGLEKQSSIVQEDIAYAVFSCRSSAYANWKVYTLLDESSFYQTIRHQATLMIITLALSIMATLVLSLLFAKRITHPLEQLTRSFHRLEQGEYPPPLEVESNDEVGQLIHSYNHVVASLEKLNENIIAEQEEKRRFEIAAVKTRLDLLQSQIRPHFIHNTLNTLNYMAIEAGNTALSEIITSFNALLRMSISTESDFCTVESEIACIKHYMRIQRSRYADRPLKCSYSIDENVKDALLPRLVLQPLVENALFHGILPMEDRMGMIQVQCVDAGDQLCVFVCDNGAGIPEDLLQRLQQGDPVSSGGYSHIGIKNVRERLDLMYQQECEFQIFSQVGRGTAIFFSVPYRR